jgi:hypothetical protein
MTPLQWSAHWVSVHRLGWRSGHGQKLRDSAGWLARRFGFALVPMKQLEELAECVADEQTSKQEPTR